MNNTKMDLGGNIKSPIMMSIIMTYYSFYGNAMLSIITDFIPEERHILKTSEDKLERACASLSIIARFFFFSDWVLDDDWDIFLREDHT